MRLRCSKTLVGFAIVVSSLACAPGAKAQDLYSSGGTVYVPYAGGGAGFLPYTPGPGGGLGVQGSSSRPLGRPSAPPSARSMAGPVDPGMASGLGSLRSTLTPLTPIRAGGMARGIGGSLLRREPSGGMGRPTRPPVGSYPFRQPSSSGPAGAGMGMQ